MIWSKEKPEKVIGIEVRLGEFDGLGPNPPKQLIGIVSDYSEGLYRIKLESPFTSQDGHTETYAKVSARHDGFPISRISKRGILGVNGSFESGNGFIALLAKV